MVTFLISKCTSIFGRLQSHSEVISKLSIFKEVYLFNITKLNTHIKNPFFHRKLCLYLQNKLISYFNFRIRSARSNKVFYYEIYSFRLH